MDKSLILSIYPAPYRAELFEILKRRFNADVFFESAGGDSREDQWFFAGDYYLLDTKEGEKAFDSSAKHINEYRFAALYDFTTKTAVKLILKCIFKKIPYTVNCDGVLMAKHGNPLFDLLKRFLISHASACLASGENAKKYFLKYKAKEENIFVHTFSTLHTGDILNAPIKSDEKSALRKKLGLPENKFISIAVGRFIPLKRYDFLIKEWANMPENHLLILVGSGSEEEKYRKIIKNSNIRNVIIESFHPKDELFEYYKAADVFVHPTSYDVWGLVLNEAFACGLPAVVSDRCVAGLELIKNGENGYLIPMGNDPFICQRIRQICETPNLQEKMSVSAIEAIRDYTIENMAKKHAYVFQNIIKIGSDTD